MPVCNALPYLDHSIRSILDQTFEDFEFVILDDGSTDGSGAVLRRWAREDRRIRLFESRRNLGLPASSNYVVLRASAPLIARMDADDVAHPERLDRQRKVFGERPEAQLVGALWEGIDAGGRRIRPRDRWRLARRSMASPFPHGSIMFRREIFDRVGGYREPCAFWEDLDFYLRVGDVGRIFVLPEALLRVRFHTGASRLSHRATQQVEGAFDLMYRCVSERRAGRDYEPLLVGGPEGEKGARRRLYPLVFFSFGSLRLWSGYTPEILGPLWRRGDLSWNLATVITIVWAVWGRLSPSSLRLALRCLIRTRDLLASRRLEDGRPHEWRFG